MTDDQTAILSKEMREFRKDVNKRFDVVDNHFDVINQRFDAVGKHFDAVGKRTNTIDGQLDRLTKLVIRRFDHTDRILETKASIIDMQTT